MIERDAAGLGRGEQILVVLVRALEQVAEIDHAAVGVDQVTLHGVQRLAGHRRRQMGECGVARDGIAACVDGLLGLDRHQPEPILPADEEALDLDVLQDLAQVTLVGGEQRIVDLAISVRQLAVQDRVADHEVRVRGADVLEQAATRSQRNQIDRVVLGLVDQSRLEFVARQPREGLLAQRVAQAGQLAEADATALLATVGEHPCEAIQRAALGATEDLERALQRLEHGALGAAVGAVEDDRLVDATHSHEAGDDVVELVLRLLLADQTVPTIELAVEQTMPRDLPRGRPHVASTEVRERVEHELRGRARVDRGVLAEQLEPLVEAQDAARGRELLGDRVGHAADARPRLAVHVGDRLGVRHVT